MYELLIGEELYRESFGLLDRVGRESMKDLLLKDSGKTTSWSNSSCE